MTAPRIPLPLERPLIHHLKPVPPHQLRDRQPQSPEPQYPSGTGMCADREGGERAEVITAGAAIRTGIGIHPTLGKELVRSMEVCFGAMEEGYIEGDLGL